MPHENYAAKQQRIGERLTRAMAKAHMNRSELAELTGYSVEQIVSWERGRARMYPIELVKAVSCARREAGVAAVLGAPPPLISRPAFSTVIRHAAALSSLSALGRRS
jgi:transcriptional regulator with XRE-family HTH domain